MLVMSAAPAKSPENRVQNIKKQFEIKRPPPLVLGDSSDGIPRKVINSTVYTEVKKKGKNASPGIKRSPAFRCDKIVRGGGVKTSSNLLASSPSKQQISVVSKVKLFEDNSPPNKKIETSNKLVNGNSNQTYAQVQNTSQSFLNEENYIKPSAFDSQYKRFVTFRSQENLVECTRDNDLYHSHEDLTTRETLNHPLPSGPPPRKPPRTFTHSPQSEMMKPFPKPTLQKENSYASILKSPPKMVNNQKSSPNKPNVNGNKPNVKPKVSPKKINDINLNERLRFPANSVNNSKPKPQMIHKSSEVQDIASKLNKSHINNTHPRASIRRNADIKRPKDPPPSMPPRSKTESHIQLRQKPANKPDLSAKGLLTACMPLNCASSQYEQTKQRLCALDISAPVLNTSLSPRLLEKSPQRSLSQEHIYAEPFNADPRAGVPVPTNPVPIMLKSTGRNGLYYMSTPIEASWQQNQRPSHLPLCSSFSTPALNRGPLNPQSPPTPQSPPPSFTTTPSPREGDTKLPLGSPPAQRTFLHVIGGKSVKTTTPCSRNIDMAAPQKPQRSALARIAQGLAKVGGQRSSSPQHAELDDTKIQVLMNRAFSSLQNSATTPTNSEDSETPLDSPLEGGFVLMPAPQSNNIHSSVRLCQSEEEDDAEGGEEEARRLVEKRKGYIRRASSKAFPTLKHRVRAPRLFQCMLLVGLKYDADACTHVPYIKSVYPENADVPQGTELFVFPDSCEWPPAGEPESYRCYTLVLTDHNGERLYGYCRRVLPEGASVCIPLAYCIVTHHKASGFYFKVLAEIESRHGQPEAMLLSFMRQLHVCSLPEPDHQLPIPGVVVSRPPDPRLEGRELAELFTCLQGTNLLLVLLASLLHERKVLLISSSLSKLTSCVLALQAAVYPFSWQHTLVTALPESMLEVCDAPTPFIIGLLKKKDGTMPPRAIDDGVVVDLDTPKLVHCVGDEEQVLPSRLRRALRRALQLVAAATGPTDALRNVLVSEAFVRMFVEVCGHFRNYIVTQQDGKKVFERESFVKAAVPSCMQMFLEWFTETAMFSVFIESRLQPGARLPEQGIFEQRAYEHMQEMEKSTLMLLKNYKVVNKKGRTFGDRIKDWSSNF